MAGSSKKASPVRRVTGQKQGQENPTASGTKVGRGLAPEKSTDVKVEQHQATSVAADTLIQGRGGFQLRAGGRTLPDGTESEEWSVEFGRRGFIVADDDTLDAFEKVLAGTWTDGKITGKQMQQCARIARIKIVRHGMETAPMPTWDALAPDSRVDVALAAGLLSTREKIAAAIRYEQQAPKHQPARDPERITIAKLEALLSAQATGVKVQGVDQLPGAAAGVGADGALLSGEQEL